MKTRGFQNWKMWVLQFKTMESESQRVPSPHLHTGRWIKVRILLRVPSDGASRASAIQPSSQHSQRNAAMLIKRILAMYIVYIYTITM